MGQSNERDAAAHGGRRMTSEAADFPRCSRLATLVGKLLLRLAGWRVQEPEYPGPKFILIAAPHTSNWDVYFMLACGWTLGLTVCWIAKDSLFRFPLGGLMRWLGGIPVDRSKNQNQVQAAAALFRDRPALIVAVAPRGPAARRSTGARASITWPSRPTSPSASAFSTTPARWAASRASTSRAATSTPT